MEPGAPRHRGCDVLGKPAKLVEKPSLLYIHGRLGGFKRVRKVCRSFGIYPGMPPRNVLRRMLGKMMVLVPAEHVLAGWGSRFWLVHLVMDRTPAGWRRTVPARMIRKCFRDHWVLRLCLTRTEAWILAGTIEAVAQCVEPLVAHAKLYAGVKLLGKEARLVAPLQVIKICKTSENTREIVYEEPYPWYYKIEPIQNT